jgi:dsDNA-binding SOS-regulon protein
MHEQKSVIRQAWEQLDEQVDEIMELTAKAEAAGFDKVIEVALERAKARALIMAPYSESAEEISAEAGQRWAARKNGTEHTTKGISITWRPGMTPGRDA